MNDTTMTTTNPPRQLRCANSCASSAASKNFSLTIETLKEENRALRQRQESLTAERSAFAQRNEQVRARVEAMIGRLKTMEHTA